MVWDGRRQMKTSHWISGQKRGLRIETGRGGDVG